MALLKASSPQNPAFGSALAPLIPETNTWKKREAVPFLQKSPGSFTATGLWLLPLAVRWFTPAADFMRSVSLLHHWKRNSAGVGEKS